MLLLALFRRDEMPAIRAHALLRLMLRKIGKIFATNFSKETDVNDQTTYEVNRLTWWRVRMLIALVDVLEPVLAWAMRHADRDLRRLEADAIRSRWSR